MTQRVSQRSEPELPGSSLCVQFKVFCFLFQLSYPCCVDISDAYTYAQASERVGRVWAGNFTDAGYNE